MLGFAGYQKAPGKFQVSNEKLSHRPETVDARRQPEARPIPSYGEDIDRLSEELIGYIADRWTGPIRDLCRSGHVSEPRLISICARLPACESALGERA